MWATNQSVSLSLSPNPRSLNIHSLIHSSRIILNCGCEPKQVRLPVSPWRPFGPNLSTFQGKLVLKLWIDVNAAFLGTLISSGETGGPGRRVRTESRLRERTKYICHYLYSHFALRLAFQTRYDLT